MKYPNVLFFAALLFFASCMAGYDYEKRYEIQNGNWEQGDTLDFTFSIKDTLSIFNLYLEVEHSTSYNFQNLYTRIYTQFPSGERINELLSLELADKAGVWLGKCNSESCILKIPIQEGAYFNQSGQFTVTVEQYMRTDPVEGIQSIGFLVEDTGQKRGGKQ